VVELLIGFLKKEKPDRLYLNGDIHDFYQVSQFAKDPARLDTFQKEINECKSLLCALKKTCNPEIHYIQGNHEKRLQKFLWKKSPQLACLDSLQVPSLLGLNDLGIKYHKKGVNLGDLYITHGSIVRKHAGYTAKAEFEKNGCSGISGHTHRDGKYSVRNRSGSFAWWENYCVCELDAEYIDGIANWSQGWSMVTTIGKRPYVEQVCVLGDKYIYNGNVRSK